MYIEHIALNVADPVALANWHVQHLGMRVVRSAEAPTFARFLADSAGRVILEVYHQARAPVPSYFDMDPMVLHIAFAVDDLAGTRDRLVQAGAKLVEDISTTASGDQLAMLRDPWGLCLQLVKRKVPMR